MYKTSRKIAKIKNTKILVFTKKKISGKLNYDNDKSIEIYNNFLKWLLKTFKINERNFRSQLFQEINFKKNQKILIIGVGTGDDVEYLLKYKKKFNLKIYMQDLSQKFMTYCFYRFNSRKNCHFNVSDAKNLPFKNNVFDHTFQFGGINLFGNMKKCINEMVRVTKKNGTINFGDEGIAPWLRNTVFADMMINNNRLWKKKLPIDLIPFHSSNVSIRWLLGNCFYFISFQKNIKFPVVNLKISHKSPKGGSILSRYMKKKHLKNVNKIILNKKNFS